MIDSMSEAVERGVEWLGRQAGPDGFQSQVGTTVGLDEVISDPSGLFPGLTTMPRELFSSMLVLDLVYLDRPSDPVGAALAALMRERRRPAGHFDFFFDEGLLPTDVDCSSIGSALIVATAGADDGVHATADRIAACVDDAGVVEVYLPPQGERRRLDAVVCANAAHLFYVLGREAEIEPTLGHIADVIDDDGWVKGTRYYQSPEAFLFFCARMVTASPAAAERFGGPLRAALDRHSLSPDASALEVAMRLGASGRVDAPSGDLASRLVHEQEADGSWAPFAVYRFGRRHGFFGSSELVTAFAVDALARVAAQEP